MKPCRRLQRVYSWITNSVRAKVATSEPASLPTRQLEVAASWGAWNGPPPLPPGEARGYGDSEIATSQERQSPRLSLALLSLAGSGPRDVVLFATMGLLRGSCCWPTPFFEQSPPSPLSHTLLHGLPGPILPRQERLAIVERSETPIFSSSGSFLVLAVRACRYACR